MADKPQKPQRAVKKVSTPAEKELLRKVKRLNTKLARVKNISEQLHTNASLGKGLTPAQVENLSKKLLEAITK